MDVDVELDAWRRDWRADPVVLPDLKDRVERETRAMKRFVVAEIVVTAVFGGGSLAWAWLSRRPDVFVLAGGIWAFIAIAWAMSSLLRRDAWAPVTSTTIAFLDLSILRCRRRRETVVAQGILYAIILAFDLAWIYFDTPEPARAGLASFLTSARIVWIWALTLVLGVLAARQRRGLARELDALTRLREQVGDASSRR